MSVVLKEGSSTLRIGRGFLVNGISQKLEIQIPLPRSESRASFTRTGIEIRNVVLPLRLRSGLKAPFAQNGSDVVDSSSLLEAGDRLCGHDNY